MANTPCMRSATWPPSAKTTSRPSRSHGQIGKYAGTSLIGKLGIEASYEPQLHGADGSRQILVNAAGRSVQRQGTLTPELQEVKPLPGRDVITTIDLPTQLVAEQGLIGRRGSVVAIDPNNGDVIAMVSTPGFDPNPFGRGLSRAEYAALRDNIDVPLLNRAIRGEYPPGSTVKPAIALGGLTLGITTPQRTRSCSGAFYLPGSSHRFRDWRPSGHGVVAMETAIAQSCDVYFYELSSMMGVDKLSGWLAHFGLGSPTNIDISGERKGILPNPAWKKARFKNPADQVWFPGETVSFGIGQGYLVVTPLQAAHMAAILAMRGKSFKPRLIGAFREQGSGKVESIKPVLLETVEASPENWKVAIDGMVKVMNERHRPAQPDRRRIPDRRQDRHGAGVHRRPERKVQREGAQRTPARPWLVHRVRARGCTEDRRGRDHRERQTWHGGRGDRAPRARPVPARPHHDAGDSAHRRRRTCPTRAGDE